MVEKALAYMTEARLPWFLLVSISVHGMYLWQWRLMPIYQYSPPPLKISLLGGVLLQERPSASEIPPRAPSARGTPVSKPPARAKSKPIDRPKARPSTQAPSSAPEATTSSGGNTADKTTLAGDIVESPTDGIALGTNGSVSPEDDVSSRIGPLINGGDDVSAVQGTASAGGSGQPFPVAEELPATEAIAQQITDIFYGEVYFIVDSYPIEGMSINAVDLCIDGQQLRTKTPITITGFETDHSLCRTNAEDREYCPPAATKTVILSVRHLRAPLSYQENVCLEYDRSNCRIRYRDDDEKEVCRPVPYEGIWADGTVFDYKCQRSEIRTYRQPLEFFVYYMVDKETADGNFRPKELRRVRYSIPRCG